MEQKQENINLLNYDSVSEIKQRVITEELTWREKRTQSITVQLDFDQALEQVGSHHWYQKRAFLFFALEWLLAGFILLCGPFIFPSPQYNCSNSHLTVEECQQQLCNLKNQTQKLNNITYGLKEGHDSFTEYYGLYCENEWKTTFISSIPYLGSFLGFLIFPMIADNFGRRPALFLSWGICNFGCLIMAAAWFHQGFWMMFMGYLIAGFGVNPAITIHYSFLNEHSIGSLREYTSIGVQIFYSIGELLFVLICYLVLNPFYIVIFAFFVPTFIMNFSIFFIYESPKFIYERDTNKAIGMLNKIAKVNKKEKIQLNTMKSMIKTENNKIFSVIDLFRYKSLTIISYAASFIFFTIQAVYYGVTFTMNSVGLSIYLNLTIIASAETLAYLVTNSIIPYLPRKWTTLVGLLLSAIISLSFLFFQTPNNCEGICTQKILQIVFAALLRFSICFTWTVIYVYFSELFPTVVRSLALGFTSNIGTIGSFGAPYLVSLCNHYEVNPLLVLGIISFVGAIHVFLLTETKGLPLQNNIKELMVEGEDILAIEINYSQVDKEHMTILND